MKKILLISFSIALLFGAGSRISYSQGGMNAMLEFCTGTWCQYCPCGDVYAHNIQNIRPQVLILAYHGPISYCRPV